MPDSERNEKLAELSRLEGLLHEEEEKRNRWLIENARRKHNYVPFIVELLRLLGKQGMLMPLYAKAKERVLKRANPSKLSDKLKADEPVKEKSSKVNEGS
jgi:ubiquitin carboxyl-terminal hydrolase L5